MKKGFISNSPSHKQVIENYNTTIVDYPEPAPKIKKMERIIEHFNESNYNFDNLLNQLEEKISILYGRENDLDQEKTQSEPITIIDMINHRLDVYDVHLNRLRTVLNILNEII